jgi:hypothetical protein
MHHSHSLAFVALLATGTLYVACDDDPGSDAPTTATTGTGAATSSSTTASGGSGGSGATGGGGAMPNCLTDPKEVETVTGDITADTTFTADKDWMLQGVVRVQAGATLTIEQCTKVIGEKASLGTLIIEKGGQIDAVGTADEPIVFTSELPPGDRAAGDWGGLVILGDAPINEPGGMASIEGFTTSETYGGNTPDDSSGTLSYVRIEFSGVEIAPDNEINGLTLGGVGSGTQIDHIEVRYTLDDCFEFFGGTVNADHLVCFRNQDDGFDMDQGYVGNLQFLFLQQDPDHAAEDNGLECDNDVMNPGVTPVTDPTIWNVTLCGHNGDVPSQQYGFLFRRGFHADIGNLIVMGFEAGVDFRNVPPTDVNGESIVFFGNAPENVAYVEDGSNMDTQVDDDGAFDDRAWFAGVAGSSEEDPGIPDCFGDSPNPVPGATIAGGTPPNGFDTSATYVGAFGAENWATGNWIAWAE